MQNLAYKLVPNPFHLKLLDASGVATDSHDNVYYTTRTMAGTSAGVLVLNSVGEFQYGFGGGGLLKNPHGICVDCDDNVLVSDAMRNCIYKFSKEGQLLMTIGTPDAPTSTGCINYDFNTIKHAAGPFGHPAKLATTTDGEIYVADGYGNCCVHHFSKDGKLIKTWAHPEISLASSIFYTALALTARIMMFMSVTVKTSEFKFSMRRAR